MGNVNSLLNKTNWLGWLKQYQDLQGVQHRPVQSGQTETQKPCDEGHGATAPPEATGSPRPPPSEVCLTGESGGGGSIIYMLCQSLSHLERDNYDVGITFLYFFSTFNAI